MLVLVVLKLYRSMAGNLECRRLFSCKKVIPGCFPLSQPPEQRRYAYGEGYLVPGTTVHCLRYAATLRYEVKL